jgi:hypothetical protein
VLGDAWLELVTSSLRSLKHENTKSRVFTEGERCLVDDRTTADTAG